MSTENANFCSKKNKKRIDKQTFEYYNGHTLVRTYVRILFGKGQSPKRDSETVSGEGSEAMKKPFVFLSLGAILGCTFFGIFLMNALAKEPPGPGTVSYYTCIRIQPGDTLWSIAEAYTEGTDITVEEYVKQLKQMNRMGEDTIHEGNYLTVMYKHPRESIETEEE